MFAMASLLVRLISTSLDVVCSLRYTDINTSCCVSEGLLVSVLSMPRRHNPILCEMLNAQHTMLDAVNPAIFTKMAVARLPVILPSISL